MDISELIEQHPVPAKLARKDAKKAVWATLSEEEFDLVAEVAYDPRYKEMFDRDIKQVLRWMVQMLAWELHDTNPSTVVTRVCDKLEANSSLYINRKLDETLDDWAFTINLLIDTDHNDKALARYKALRHILLEEEEPWNDILYQRILSHSDLRRAHNRLVRWDPIAVKEVDDEYEGGEI